MKVSTAEEFREHALVRIQDEQQGELVILKYLKYVGALELIRRDLATREFVDHLVALQLESPKVQVNVIQSWPDDLLVKICSIWNVEIGLEEPPDRQEAYFKAFQQKLIEHSKTVAAEIAFTMRGTLSKLSVLK